MNNIYLSKSKYCKAIQCNKILWLDKNKPEEAIQTAKDSVLENGTKVGELARNYFGKYTNVEFNKDLNQMLEDTQKYISENIKIITEASFNYDNNFCSVDILKNDLDGFEIYEVKSSTDVHEIYLEDVSYQVYVLTNLGYKVKKASIMYINNKYVRNGDLDLKQLFNIEDVTEIAFSKQEKIKNNIEEINKYMQNATEPEKELSMNCFNPYECPYWKYCTRHLPEKNVFDIRIMHRDKKMELYNKGIYEYDDLLKEDIGWKYRQQIEVDLKDGIIIDKEKIKEFMDTLSYPIYFLDFETYQSAIPEYDNSWSYEQITFQYSLHYIEKENGELKHTEFLAEPGTDPRRKLAERLVKDIPKDVCVTAYNMGFEKGRIKELAKLYPDLSEHLMNVHDNIKDLMTPFFYRWYYIKAMQGSYSIKNVLPALFPNDPELDYHNLPLVHNGGEASSIFIDLKNHSKEEQEEIRKGLLVYCKLDTYAMVKVWEKLKEVIRDGK